MIKEILLNNYEIRGDDIKHLVKQVIKNLLNTTEKEVHTGTIINENNTSDNSPPWVFYAETLLENVININEEDSLHLYLTLGKNVFNNWRL